MEWSQAETLRRGDEVMALSVEGPLRMIVLEGPIVDEAEFESCGCVARRTGPSFKQAVRRETSVSGVSRGRSNL